LDGEKVMVFLVWRTYTSETLGKCSQTSLELLYQKMLIGAYWEDSGDVLVFIYRKRRKLLNENMNSLNAVKNGGGWGHNKER
jgi:hypothetical protein